VGILEVQEVVVRTWNLLLAAALASAVAGLDQPVEAQNRNPRAPQPGRFAGLDRDGDGYITRSEWRGSHQSFSVHDRNGDGVLEYAQRILSTEGKRDGLYWPTAAGESPSPAGPLLDTTDLKDGYHGYRFRILKGQGPAARGGARSYVDRAGRMTSGFALVAWPARYGETGVMTLVVNHDGVAYQKNLGPSTAAVVGATTRFDPAPTWQALPAP